MDDLRGPIAKVQEDVLQLFHDMLLMNGIRSLEFFISKFENPQKVVVSASNVPSMEKFQELKRHVILPPQWRGRKRPLDQLQADNLVEIHIEAPPLCSTGKD
ncbi:MAG: hypothetical protein SVY53_01290 [Chloroflexota bacterium]|nr:hypothetical protein [Chloroflexota bacterium]